MPDVALRSEPTPTPDTGRAVTGTEVPSGIAIALYVVRFLIAYACHIAAKAEECAVRGDIRPVTLPFDKSIAIDQLIIRVARGLRRALMVQQMLQQRAATGRDLEPVARREHPHAGGTRKNGQNQEKPPKPERLPSEAEIAAELQRRPLGAIVADICADIGIVPSDLTDEQWNALQWVIHEFGGDRMKLWPAMRNRMVADMAEVAVNPHAETPWLPMIPWTRKAQVRGPSACTGPPWPGV